MGAVDAALPLEFACVRQDVLGKACAPALRAPVRGRSVACHNALAKEVKSALNVSVPAPGREVALRSLLPSWALAHGLRSCGSEREDKLAGARALTRRHNRSRAGRG